jgi:hypothetical protein
MNWTWWVKEVIVPVLSTLIGVGGPILLGVALFNRQRRQDRDLQWRTDRREAYEAFFGHSDAFCNQLALADADFGGPLSETAQELRREALWRQVDMAGVAAKLTMLAPQALVGHAHRIVDMARDLTRPGTPGLAELEAEVREFKAAARADLGLGRWSPPPMPALEPSEPTSGHAT